MLLNQNLYQGHIFHICIFYSYVFCVHLNKLYVCFKLNYSDVYSCILKVLHRDVCNLMLQSRSYNIITVV